MNSKIQLLDCTLRDGSYIVDGNFGAKAISGIVKRLQDAKVDIIECGWLKNTEYKIGSAYYHVPDDFKQYLTFPKNPNVMFVAMIDYNRYDLTQLPVCDGGSIDAIRVVFPKGKEDEGLALATPIREKGYKVFFQIANTLGYTDIELLRLVEKLNRIKPEGVSIVDTFGAMYGDDLHRMISLFAHNLDRDIKLGFHSHNNLQLSFALAIQFVDELAVTDRFIVVDSSICGMGRGAGNANTELLMGFLNRKYHRNYDMDVIMDAIDIYMTQFLNSYEWGYSIPYFISGTYCTHVNNIAYLIKQHKTRSRDIKKIIEALDSETRRIYDYDNLDRVYVDYQSNEVDDTQVKNRLAEELSEKTVILIMPGKTALKYQSCVKESAEKEHAVLIGVNAAVDGYVYDYIFFSNKVRYDYAMEAGQGDFGDAKLILTSNIKNSGDENTYIVNYNSLLYRGWKLYEVSVMLMLNLLNYVAPLKIGIAGLDGWAGQEDNYSDSNMEVSLNADDSKAFNQDLEEMLDDYIIRVKGQIKVEFITPSRFEKRGENI